MTNPDPRLVHLDLPETHDAVHPSHGLLRVLRPAGRAWFRGWHHMRTYGEEFVGRRPCTP